MHIVWLTPFLCSGERSGADIASQNLVDGLRGLGHTVTVAGYHSPHGVLPGPGEISLGPPVGEASTAGMPRRLAWLVRAGLRGTPLCVEKFRSRRFTDRLPELWAGADLVVTSQLHLDWLAPANGPPFLAVAQNVESAVYAEQAQEARGPLRWLLQREARLLAKIEARQARRAAGVIALTEADAERFASQGARVVSAPLVGISPQASAAPTTAEFDVGLLGLWTWAPNRRGLDWFVAEVLPRLPSCWSVAIAGRGADDLRDHPRLTVMGSVPSAEGFLRRCHMLAIPATAGGGVQVKTINALALGAPTVATGLALRGIADPPALCLRADDPTGFASALVHLHGASWNPAAGTAWQALRRECLLTTLAAVVDGAMAGRSAQT